MKNFWKFIIVVILAGAVIGVIALKKSQQKDSQVQEPITKVEIVEPVTNGQNETIKPTQAEPPAATIVTEIQIAEKAVEPIIVEAVKLPRMIELGASWCVPCKMMKPVLEELKNEYKGKLEIQALDTSKDSSLGAKYRINFIPLQIFYNTDGEELFRHEGFFAKKDILAKWKELGFDFAK